MPSRGDLFVGPGMEVSEGMIIGENARAEDIDVNPTKEKKLANHRAAAADDMIRLAPPRPLSLELALKTTPKSIRLRKAVLDQTVRGRTTKRATTASASASSLLPTFLAR